MGLFKRKKENTKDIMATTDGKIKNLSTLKDGVFSEKMMGDGIVIASPASAKKADFFAPISGELVTVFPTGHAYGIRAKDGLEILIHIGLDTVNLEGKGFTTHVKQGQKVKVGEKLATVDLEYVRKNAPSSDAIVIITSGQKIASTAKGEVKVGTKIITVE